MDSLFLFSVVVGLAVAGLLMFSIFWLGQRQTSDTKQKPEEADDVSMLFQKDKLADADDTIWEVLPLTDTRDLDWKTVRALLLPLLPALPEKLAPTKTPFFDPAGACVKIVALGDTLRVTISPENNARRDWLRLRAATHALAQTEPALANSPNPIWAVDCENTFIWGNTAFRQLADRFGGTGSFVSWVCEQCAETPDEEKPRIHVPQGSCRHARWYEIATESVSEGTLYFATSVDAVVQAEEAQRKFAQTLSKTFANLTAGSAIFDRDRRLALFNPALVDLSNLPVEFLSGRPNLFEFFDKLRERRIMPEPKNYDNWRERMAKLVAAASDDRFRETWNLAGGQTFDVTGRPYPDGAIAFLFNDITAEVSLARGFRSELETMQSALDVLEDAVAIFDRQGNLTICNTSYKDMWKIDPDASIDQATIVDSVQQWKSAFHPNPVWPELCDFVTTATDRASWDNELRSKDGREVICRIDPVCYGATLIRFCRMAGRQKQAPDMDSLQIVSA